LISECDVETDAVVIPDPIQQRSRITIGIAQYYPRGSLCGDREDCCKRPLPPEEDRQVYLEEWASYSGARCLSAETPMLRLLRMRG